MTTNAPTGMPRINISFSLFAQLLSKINNSLFKNTSIDALGKVQKVQQAQSRFLIWYPELTTVHEIGELLDDLRSVRDFLFDMEHRLYSGQESERNMLKQLEEVTTNLEKQLDCIQLAINKLDPYRGPKDIYGMYHGVLVDAKLAKAPQENGTNEIEEQMMELDI
ncbi:uncharacterized protein BKA55DRAFT_666099 [Fusarium redolens]|uniref:Uncharacterized protein n=1 Tax=Fusarium redolens TaxID=48865 RepID=A0A9P9JWG8_FUSRE|nr:uncharacterized protein BKA55DRAFT_666099 [Fusarium redolens]KAH7240177.1 hypothetical protein BKA55DRAFT_666099 [Fusarium redolens]